LLARWNVAQKSQFFRSPQSKQNKNPKEEN